MGEMADYFIEQQMFPEDAHWYVDDWMDPEDGYRGPQTKTCRCCGKSGLQWGTIDGKWRLFAGNHLHVCLVHPLKIG